jgi:hypothetical protein
MKRFTIFACLCLAAAMLLAMAVPAFAEGSSGTIYGKAVLAPYAIVLSGGGTDSQSPLTYEGLLGQTVAEKYGSTFTIQNVGTQVADIRISQDTPPTANSSTWGLGVWSPYLATWRFFNGIHSSYVLPNYDAQYVNVSQMTELNPGGSDTFSSSFGFPQTSDSSADHYMSATISAAAPY